MGQRLNALEGHPQFIEALSVARRLKDAGFEVYFAGGCVRDALLGIHAKDIDLATEANPDQVEEVFLKTIPVGKGFGTMIVVCDSYQFEVTTFRSDGVYLDGRHPESIRFTDAREDALRRDFTVNAMFYDPFTHDVIDFVEGEADLKQHLIRAVGEAKTRFEEDKLRLLRAIRFASQLGFQIEQKTWEALSAAHADLAVVARERVLNELLKLLSSRFKVLGVRKLVESKLALDFWPSLQSLSTNEASFQKFIKGLPILTKPAAVFAYFMIISEDRAQFRQEIERLKPARHLIATIDTLVRIQEELWNPETRKAHRVRAFAHPDIDSIIELSILASEYEVNGFAKIAGWVEDYLKVCDQNGQLPKNFIKGDDLLNLGYRPGPAIGRVLEECYLLQLEGEINSIEQAVQMAKSSRHWAETNNEV